ncbi:MAG: glycosyltransferase [Acidimicrobiaceae bacterium]|nr:glycosyltransferase [Acidimicrobiaceae bacterium]
MNTERAFAVVTGGGTSGHVLPALAIADALVAGGHERASIHYVGTRRGVETTLLPPTGYPHTFLDVVGLQRSVSARNLAFLPKLFGAVRAAKALLQELQPKVVVNVGGYGSFPATWAARRLQIPYVVVSYDHRPGLVSKLMAKRAAACAVAFEGSVLPHAELTGAPVRQEMVGLDRAAARPPLVRRCACRPTASWWPWCAVRKARQWSTAWSRRPSSGGSIVATWRCTTSLVTGFSRMPRPLATVRQASCIA